MLKEILPKIDMEPFFVAPIEDKLDVDYPIVKVDAKASWMFVCGKRVHQNGKLTRGPLSDVRVANEYGEVLGIGYNTKHGIKNVYDIGRLIRSHTLS